MIMAAFIKRLKRVFKIQIIRRKNPTCRIGKNVKINGSQLGEYVTLFDNVVLFNTRIGSYSYVQDSAQLNNCEVGKFCSIAPNVIVAPGKHNPFFTSTSALFFSEHPKLPVNFKAVDYLSNEKVSIGNDVWIGVNSVILDGVTIGDGAIIGAGTIVTKDVEPYSIVGGVPGKHIRYRFSEEEVQVLIKKPWWDNQFPWFCKNKELLVDIEKYKDYVESIQKD